MAFIQRTISLSAFAGPRKASIDRMVLSRSQIEQVKQRSGRGVTTEGGGGPVR
ncbi:MAG: hypothetical protein M3256_02750 [Actinomycetota bacterium]|nr:hypothetical protein [Actinomycetota bacterium]